jgi:serine/threonine-protein phosphatase 2B regulatory subunit
MGAYYSDLGVLRPDELDSLSQGVHFNKQEVQALFARFKKLDRDGRGVINRGDLIKIPQLAMNPLVERIIQCFDADDEGNVTFTSFLNCLSHLSHRSSAAEKLSIAFRVYDIDKDGYISDAELCEILRLMAGGNMTEDRIRRVATDTVAAAAADGGNRISMDDFRRLFQNREAELCSSFSVNVLTMLD